MTASLIQLITAYVFAVLLLWAAASDIRSYTIPNWISIALAVGFPVAVLSAPTDIPVVEHALTAGAIFAGTFALFCRRLMGGGDVKLWTALALWLGPELIVIHVILVALLGGLLGVMLLIQRSAIRAGGTPVSRTSVPYGVPIVVAALWLLPRMSVISI